MDEEKLGFTLDEAVSKIMNIIKEYQQANPEPVQVAIAIDVEKDNSLSDILFLALPGKDNEIINNLKKDIHEFDS